MGRPRTGTRAASHHHGSSPGGDAERSAVYDDLRSHDMSLNAVQGRLYRYRLSIRIARYAELLGAPLA
jgi:hypothetical protein